jgi:hypothetical protein
MNNNSFDRKNSTSMFIIEDEKHAELQQGEFKTFDEAIERLKSISQIPWDNEPNKCPCTNWKECERNYQIVEYKTTETPWTELQRIDILTVSAKGVKWTA